VLLASTVLTVLLASGVAWAATVDCANGSDLFCRGTDGPDTIYGTDGRDLVKAGGGTDKVYGRAGADGDGELNAGLEGGDGDDDLFGDRGTDRLFGGRGGDFITGETHNFVGSAPGDLLAGGPGNDFFRARDGQKDRVYCGTGVDEVFADDSKKSGSNDTGVRDYVDDSCERVDRY